MIRLGDIHPGDEVLIRDCLGNQARGAAYIDHRDGVLYLAAFGGRVVFARRTGGGWRRVNQITVVWHQPPLLEAVQ
jgi:hypothetical protein